MNTAATLPPAGLPGLDPAWSRLVAVPDGSAPAPVERTWHVLDTQTPDPVGTLLCVHGNPTWSYLWRHVVAAAPPGWRVVAPDQLGMGWSERVPGPRRLAQRIADLGALTDALGIDGPVVTVAHDWGGVISLGWALEHRAQLAGVVLTNTAVAQPEGARVPAALELARSVREFACVRTPTFVRAATAVSRPALPREVRDAFAAPYGTAERRRAVGDFVADIPLGDAHPSTPALRAVTDRLPELRDVPALVLWGPRDPVFIERYLRDVLDRLPQAQVHRYEGAAHLVTEDRPESAQAIAAWVGSLGRSAEPAPPVDPVPPVWAELEARRDDPSPAVVELSGDGRTASWHELHARVHDLAAGLVDAGVRPGDRIGLLVPPGIDLTVAVYASWRAGATIVVADAGLGLRALGRALRGAAPDHLIGIPKALAAARLLRVPGRRIAVGSWPGADATLEQLVARGRTTSAVLPAHAGAPESVCAVVFTSGATGPAKGVRYRHRQLQQQLALLRTTFGLTPDDRLVAAFAPFALYGPALGLPSAVPDMDVTAPDTLTAAALADAVARIDASVVFASPAALRNVLATAGSLDTPRGRALAHVRLFMSAGAPVPAPLLGRLAELMPKATLHTPYGMTEALPVADITLEEIVAAGSGDGVCVGRPLPGVEVRLSPLDALGRAEGALTAEPGITGEICVSALHIKDSYDRLWDTERRSGRTEGWHRTGDVGHLDTAGRLWVEGRLVHVVVTADGPVTPVGPERRIEDATRVRGAAVVGVGPIGAQQSVAVLTHGRRAGLAPAGLAAAARDASGVPLAAVLVTPALPVDIRHASKVDRTRVARWAERVLAGGRVGRP